MSQEFAIDSVVNMDLPNEVKWSQRNGQFYVNCPFCGGVHKMNINTDKNLWRCAKCGEGGNGFIHVLQGFQIQMPTKIW